MKTSWKIQCQWNKVYLMPIWKLQVTLSYFLVWIKKKKGKLKLLPFPHWAFQINDESVIFMHTLCEQSLFCRLEWLDMINQPKRRVLQITDKKKAKFYFYMNWVMTGGSKREFVLYLNNFARYPFHIVGVYVSMRLFVVLRVLWVRWEFTVVPECN